jgi:hypothetical protein
LFLGVLIGVMVTVYAIMALMFYFLPGAAP